MRTVPLHGKIAAGRVALVDDEDYELVMARRWFVLMTSRSGPYAYAPSGVPSRRVTAYMHTLITGWPLTDHINHDGLDNQRANLRPATQAQNNANQRPRKRGTSQYKGVYWHRAAKKWLAQIQVSGAHHYLGLFGAEEDAARAYDAAALAAWGEYACPNFPG